MDEGERQNGNRENEREQTLHGEMQNSTSFRRRGFLYDQRCSAPLVAIVAALVAKNYIGGSFTVTRWEIPGRTIFRTLTTIIRETRD